MRSPALRGPAVPGRVVALVVGVATAGLVLGLGVSGVVSREWNQFAHGSAAGSGTTRSRLTSLEEKIESSSGGSRFTPSASDRSSAMAPVPTSSPTTSAGPTRVALPTRTTSTCRHSQKSGSSASSCSQSSSSERSSCSRSGSAAPGRTVYAVLFAVALSWAIHAGVDWDWEMPAVTLWLFIATGAALASRPRPPGDHPELRNRNLIAVGFLVLAVAPLLIGVSYQRLRASGEQFAAGNCVKARQDAFSSISLLAVRPEAYQIISLCDLQLDFPLEGLQAAREAVHYESNNWNYQYGLALARAENGLNPRPAARKALQLDPLEPIVQDEVAAFSRTGRSGWEQAAPELLIGGLQSEGLAISNL